MSPITRTVDFTVAFFVDFKGTAILSGVSKTGTFCIGVKLHWGKSDTNGATTSS